MSVTKMLRLILVWRANGSMRDVPSEAAVSLVLVECRVEEMHVVTLLRLNNKEEGGIGVGGLDGTTIWIPPVAPVSFCAYCTYNVAMLSVCMSSNCFGSVMSTACICIIYPRNEDSWFYERCASEAVFI